MIENGGKPHDIIPFDESAIDKVGNTKSFYDLNNNVVAKMLSINKGANGNVAVVSPFFTDGTLNMLSGVLNKREQEINSLRKLHENLPTATSFYSSKNKGMYAPYFNSYVQAQRKIVDDYNSGVHSKAINSLNGRLKSLDARIASIQTGISDLESQAAFPVTNTNVTGNNLYKLQQELAEATREYTGVNNKIVMLNNRNKKALAAIESINSGTVTKEVASDIHSFISNRLETTIAEKSKIYGRPSLANGQINNLIESVREELEFKTFKSQEEFYSALSTLDIDDQEKALLKGFYKTSTDSDGRPVIKKVDYLSEETIVVNPSSTSGTRFKLDGIDSIENFDARPSNVGKYLSAVDVDEIREQANVNSGAITYQEAKTIEKMIDNYTNVQNDLSLVERAYIHQSRKPTNPIYEENLKLDRDYQANIEKKHKLLNPDGTSKPKYDPVIDSMTGLDESVRDRLKLRSATSSSVGESMPSANRVYANIDVFSLREVAERKGVQPNVRASIHNFLSSIDKLNVYNKAIENGEYHTLTSSERTPMYGMPYSTKEEIEALVTTARKHVLGGAHSDAMLLSNTLKQIDYSSYFKELEAISDILRENSENEIIQAGYFDAGSPSSKIDYKKESEDALYKYNKRMMDAINANEDQFLTMQTAINADELGVVSKTRQRDTELVNSGLNKATKAYDIRSIGRDVKGATGITASQLEQGYVITDNGKNVPLQAYDEFNEQMSVSKIRGSKQFRGYNVMFTPDEWENGIVSFGENTYDIRKFEEYYSKDVRKVQREAMLSIPDYPEAVGKMRIEERLNKELSEYVKTATQPVEYISRKTVTLEDGTKKKVRVPVNVDVPLFASKEDIPPRYKRTMKGLKSIQPLNLDINMDNYEEIFKEFGIDPLKTPIGRNISSYKKLLELDPTELTERDFSHLDRVVEYKRLKGQTTTDPITGEQVPIQRKVMLEKPVDTRVQRTIDEAIESNRVVQLDGDILHYNVVGQSDGYATLEADHILFKDMTVDVEYTGNKTLEELLDGINKLQDTPAMSGKEVEMKNVTIENTDDIILGGNSENGALAVKRSDVYNYIFGKNETITINSTDKNGITSYKKHKINKTAYDVMSVNWPWMLADEEAVNIGYLGVHEALNEVTEIDVMDAVERINTQRMSKGMDLIDLSDPKAINRDTIMQTIETAINQRSKGKIIKAQMEKESASGDPAIRVALKTLEARGIEPTPDNVRSQLYAIRDVFNEPQYSFLYGNVDTIINDMEYIKQELRVNAAPPMSLDAYAVQEQRYQEYLDRYSDGTLAPSELDFDLIEDAKAYKDMTEAERRTIEKQRASGSFELFKSSFNEEIDADIMKNTPALRPENVQEVFVGNYISEDFSNRWVSNKVPKARRKEMAEFNGNWKKLKKLHGLEWISAKERVDKRINSATFKSKEEAKTIIGKSYDELVSKSGLPTQIKESMITNREANISKILEASKIKTQKGKAKYKLSRAYKGVRDVMLDSIRPLYTGSETGNKVNALLSGSVSSTPNGIGTFSSKNSFVKALMTVNDVYGVSGVSEVLETIGGTPGKGFEVLFGSNPNNILKGLSISTGDGSYNEGLSINSGAGLKFFQMLSELAGGDKDGIGGSINIIGRGVTNKGELVTLSLNDFKNVDGLTSDVALSVAGKPYKMVESSLDARTTIPKNILSPSDIHLAKESPAIHQISRGIESYGLIPSSIVNYDFVSGKYGSVGMADPTTSIANIKSLVGGTAKVTSFDFETSGLLGKIDNDLFVPVEFGYIDGVSKDGKIIGEEARSIFARPTEAVSKKILGGGMDYGVDDEYTKAVNSVIAGLSDNNSTYNLYKNYAKYDKASGSMFMEDFQIIKSKGQGGSIEELVSVGGKTMSKLDYAEGLIDSARSVVDYMINPFKHDENPTKINGPVVSIKNFLKAVNEKLADSDFILGHNSNSADLRWLEFWGNKYGVGERNLPLKNIDTFEMFKIAYPGKKSYKLENHIASKGVSSAHIAATDVAGNISLFNELIGTSYIKDAMGELDDTMAPGQIFVKSQHGNLGIKGLGKGVYRYEGVKPIKRSIVGVDGTTHHYTQQMLILRDMLSDTEMSLTFDNVATLRRESMLNWSAFGSLEEAMNYHQKVQTSDTNRTMRRAFNYSAWNDYSAKGNNLEEQVITVLSGLNSRLQSGLLDQEALRITEGVYSSGNIDDLGLLALSNAKKVAGSGYYKEVAKAGNFKESRLPEYKNFVNYANSEEGQLVKSFLYEGDLRKRVYNRNNKTNAVKDYENEIYNIVKDVREKNGYVNEVPNVKTVARANQDVFNKLGAEKYSMTGLDDFRIDVDFTNRSTISNSLWNSADTISEKILASGVITDRNSAKNVALNEFVMPILASTINDKSIMDDDLISNISILRSNSLVGETGAIIDVDENISRTLDVLTQRLAKASKNKSEFINNLETVKEVNMHTVIPDTDGANKHIIEELKTRFESALSSLDENLATITIIQNGEQKEAISENVRFVQNQLVEIKRANDTGYKMAIKEAFGVEDVDAVAAHLNLDWKNSKGRELHGAIASIEEANYNAKNPELSFLSAKEIKAKADALYTDMNIPTEKELTGLLAELQASKGNNLDEIYAKNPDFIDYLRNVFKGFYTKPSNIKTLNEEVKNATVKYVESFNAKGLKTLKRQKDVYYKELLDRASLEDVKNGNVVGEISDEIYNSHLTKYRAMEELGLIQTHNGKRFTGPIGMAGNFIEGSELDPSKVIIASSPRLSTPSVPSAPTGEFAGYRLTDLTYDELKAIKEDQYTKKSQKSIISRYMNTLDRSMNGPNQEEALKNYNKNAMIGRAERKKAMGEVQFEAIKESMADENVSPVKALNESIKENAENKAETGASNLNGAARQAFDDAIDDAPEWSITGNPHYRKFVDGLNDGKNKSFAFLKDIFGSKTVRYSAIAASAALAFALTRQYTSDGGTQEEKQQSSARPVDDNYQKEYNGVNRNRISIPKAVRLEENGKGLNITARAKNRNYVVDGAIDDAISSSLNESIGANVNIRYQDDRESINQDYVQGLFSSALR